MLVISRTKGQTIMIGDDIEVTIVDIDGGRVRFGVNAPSGMPVVRGKDPAQQLVMVGADVSVQVVGIRDDKVRVGVDAPRHMSVHRKEVYDAIRRDNSAARANPNAQTSGPPRNPAKVLHDDIAEELVMKFSEAAEPLIDEIRQMSDVDMLKQIAAAMESATTLADIRRVWTK